MRRHYRQRWRKPPLSEDLILQWADDHFKHKGEWPTAELGAIRAAPNERWSAVSMALKAGVRDLPGGSSLARLLAERRNVRNRKGLPPVTVKRILHWADAYHARTGKWPNASSGPIPDPTPGETWLRIHKAINNGCRGFPPGTSLAWILAEHRGVGDYYTRTQISEPEILRWADNYHRSRGKWPTVTDEAILESPGDSWKRIDSALRRGERGLKGQYSLAQLLNDRRNVRNIGNLPRLTKKQILSWADVHHDKTGEWPTENSGAIAEADGETWIKVSEAMRIGRRGFAPGGSLARLLEVFGRKRNRKNYPAFSEILILEWADQHFRATGSWPNVNSGPVVSAPDESWRVIDQALQKGTRGLKGGSSLLRLLVRNRGIPNPIKPPRLSKKQICEWADDHRKRTGRWPQASSGPIHAEPETTWSAVNDALWSGRRGFPGGSSLSKVLARHRRSVFAACMMCSRQK